MLKYERERTALAVLLMRRLYFYNRSCMAVQGGYFFMFFMTSHNATNKIINITVSVINTTPFLKGVRTTAAVLLLCYYSTFYYRVQYTKLLIYRGQVCIFCLLIYWVQYSTIYSQKRNRATAKADGVG